MRVSRFSVGDPEELREGSSVSFFGLYLVMEMSGQIEISHLSFINKLREADLSKDVRQKRERY